MHLLIAMETPTKSISSIIKKNIYKWHRIIGLITIIPVIFWCVSGLMHPFMAHWFKPKIAHEFIKPSTLKPEQVKLSLQEALLKQGIVRFKACRIVQFDNNTFYQVKVQADQVLYINAASGELLIDGDRHYAVWLARFFLNDQQSSVKEAVIQTAFSQEYKYVNRLLPVWKISFDRPDQMDIYVETTSSRLGTFNTASRKTFLWIFDTFHNWSWLGQLRVWVASVLLSIIILATLSGLGIYGIWWKHFAKPQAGKHKLLKYHRQIGLSVSLVALAFAGSGLYHLLHKPEQDLLSKMVHEPLLQAEALELPSSQAIQDWERVYNLSVVKIGKSQYFQVFHAKTEEKPAEVRYIHAQKGTILENGDMVYAKFLANKFAAFVGKPAEDLGCCSIASAEEDILSDEQLVKSAVLTKFESREYGFVFKRLPVIQLAYNTPEQDAYYIETSSSHLSAHVRNADRREGYSFAIFHKYLLMDWAGKDVRDIVTLLSAMGVLSVSLLGLSIWLQKR
jgi:hypothetical protein